MEIDFGMQTVQAGAMLTFPDASYANQPLNPKNIPPPIDVQSCQHTVISIIGSTQPNITPIQGSC